MTDEQNFEPNFTKIEFAKVARIKKKSDQNKMIGSKK